MAGHLPASSHPGAVPPFWRSVEAEQPIVRSHERPDIAASWRFTRCIATRCIGKAMGPPATGTRLTASRQSAQELLPAISPHL